MDRIERSIQMKRHITNNPVLIGKNWENFCNAAQNRNVILFGLSKILDYLWIRCSKNFNIIAAIDNDIKSQGHVLGEFFDEIDLKDAKNLKISSQSILNEYDSDDVVVLISSLRYSEEIATELDNKGFRCYFSVLHLEYNYRENMKNNHLTFETQEEHMKKYAKECAEKEAIKNDKIVFYMGSYIDHGKYITNQLLLINKEIDIVWIVNKPILDIPKGVRVINNVKVKQSIYELETASIWIVSAIVPLYLLKRKKQIYINVKHWGSITLKKFGLEDIGAFKKFIDKSTFENSEKLCRLNGKMIDYLISGSEFDENSFRKGYAFQGKCIRLGSPRSDVMFDKKNCKEKIYKYFNLMSSENILLYAPTFRYNNVKSGDLKYVFQNFLDFNKLFKALINRWGGKWKIFLRLHPSISILSKKIKYPDFVIDVSHYDDSQELLSASDILISDYSSLMFEPAYVFKKVFLYAPDKDIFEKNSRELLIDYDTLPFPISITNEELAEQIKNFNYDRYKDNVQAFLDKYGVHEDGHASERAAKFIAELLGE